MDVSNIGLRTLQSGSGSCSCGLWDQCMVMWFVHILWFYVIAVLKIKTIPRQIGDSILAKICSKFLLISTLVFDFQQTLFHFLETSHLMIPFLIDSNYLINGR